MWSDDEVTRLRCSRCTDYSRPRHTRRLTRYQRGLGAAADGFDRSLPTRASRPVGSRSNTGSHRYPHQFGRTLSLPTRDGSRSASCCDAMQEEFKLGDTLLIDRSHGSRDDRPLPSAANRWHSNEGYRSNQTKQWASTDAARLFFYLSKIDRAATTERSHTRVMASDSERLTREEFASLLTVGNTCAVLEPPAVIPASHRARLVGLGYMVHLSGRLRMTTPGRLRIRKEAIKNTGAPKRAHVNL
jgi:hypothetical protein